MTETSVSELNRVLTIAKSVILEPRIFYRSHSFTDGNFKAFVFVATMGIVTGLITALWSFLGGGHFAGLTPGLAMLIILPLVIVIGSYIWAGILHIVWLLLGSREEYDVAFQCVAYSCAIFPVVAVLSVFPYVSNTLATIWIIVLMIYASIEVFNLKFRSSGIAFSLIGTCLLLLNFSGEKAERQIQDRVKQFNSQMSELQNMDKSEIEQMEDPGLATFDPDE